MVDYSILIKGRLDRKGGVFEIFKRLEKEEFLIFEKELLLIEIICGIILFFEINFFFTKCH